MAPYSLSYLKVNHPYTDPEIENIIKNQLSSKDPIGKVSTYNKLFTTNSIQTNKEHFSGWLYHLDHALLECARVLRPDGVLIILESKGVAYDEPKREGTKYEKR